MANPKPPTAPEQPSEREAIFGKRERFAPSAGASPEAFSDCPRGTAWLPNKVNFPGGPGWSDRYSGPVVMGPDGLSPLGLWYFPNVTGHHANVGGFWISASGGNIIQVKKTSSPVPAE